MITRNTRELPAQLERTRQRFDRWRQTRQGRARIPESLWASAVRATRKYGLNRTVRALRLDYNALKKHVEAVPSGRGSDRKTVAKSTAGEIRCSEFIELAPAASAGFPECLLELEDPGGAKMRIHLKGVEAPDLEALSRSFWSLRPRRGSPS
jgi:hypothetical protein